MTKLEQNANAALALEEFPKAAIATTQANVRRCIAAFAAEGDRAAREGRSAEERRQLATMAYKLNMPVMDSRESIKANIACVAVGIQLGIFNGKDGSQLLYAAQVALSLLHEAKAAGRPKNARRAA